MRSWTKLRQFLRASYLLFYKRCFLKIYMYSPGSDKLTEVQLYMSISCQPDNRVIRVFSDVEKPFLFSVFADFYKSVSCQPGSRVIRAFSDVAKPFLFSDLAPNQ